MIRLGLRNLLLACLCTVLNAQAGQWLDVPFVKQTAEGCGAASIAMVMQYWNAQHSKQDGNSSDSNFILQKLYSGKAKGVYASSMESYLREHGYNVFSFKGEWADLQQHIAKGRPLIVALQPRASSRVLHYVVVSGMDAPNDEVLFNDPAGRKLEKLDRRAFERQWRATDNWTLLAVPQA
jgi:uncharacterized protein YvpB